MTKVAKKHFALILVVTLLIAATFCGCQSNEDRIVGYWKNVEGGSFSYLEFFSDGTYDSSHINYSGNYSMDGDRLKLTGILVETKVYTFEIKGNTLNLLNRDGEVFASYEKVN